MLCNQCTAPATPHARLRAHTLNTQPQFAELQADPRYGESLTRATTLASDLAAKASAAAAPHVSKASELAAAARGQAAQVAKELEAVIDKQMRAVPALAP